jgi:tRNA1(Val) A37 N6-methylase TrmN6
LLLGNQGGKNQLSAISKQDFVKYINNFDFKGLFIDMGWHNENIKENIEIENVQYKLHAIAEMSNFKIFTCEASDGSIPLYKIRRQIEAKANKLYPRLLIIFVDSKKQEQVWLLVTRELNQRTKPSEVSWSKGKSCELLYQRTSGLGFEIDDEGKITIIDVSNLVNTQFSQNNERVTKKFYERFRTEHDVFLDFITGIENQIHKDWYASLMLNRLMFCYFIQKRRFLDNDPDYLRNRLKLCKDKHGKNKFYSFYRNFLLTLFHQGLGQPVHNEELKKEIGIIPYLNGGLFDVHELEQKYIQIDIADEAFDKIFIFFDCYQWTLDTRPTSQQDEINPDVIGYIFEKYINNRADNGAYYTKEDITEYIGKNCIIPKLFDAVEYNWPHPFKKEGDIWRMAQSGGDTYIYDAVKKGIEKKLPPEIEKGVKNVHERTEWNKTASGEYALPTEIWREVAERRSHYTEINKKLKSGTIRHINDFITYNLNIRQFAQDAIEHSDDPDFIGAWWDALNKITILDPTCGSGAFLFAALNILEPLYESCIVRIRGFVEDEDRLNREHKSQFSNRLSNFRQILADIQNPRHPNQKYFIFKTIILNNLYGVDIMNEAVEIAKLRLFLKLVATVEADYRKPNLGLEPLPDIDFNIRCGNTLVGFTTKADIENFFTARLGFNEDELNSILDHCAALSKEFTLFQQIQLSEGSDGYSYKKIKQSLQTQIVELRNKLNTLLVLYYGIDLKNKKQYTEWILSHQPFHWYAEFYRIIAGNGGFDVVIGNPPYVEYSKIKKYYKVKNYKTEEAGNIYSFITENCINILKDTGYMSMIVQNSLVCTKRMISIQKILIQKFDLYISNYDDRPAKLFTGLNHMKGSIFIGIPKSKGINYTTNFHRWYDEFRDYIFVTLTYNTLPNSLAFEGHLSKFSSDVHKFILQKIYKQNALASLLCDTGNIVYCHRIASYFIKAIDFIPYFYNETQGQKKSDDYKEYFTNTEENKYILVALFNSSIFYVNWHTLHDGYHCGKLNINEFPFNFPTDVSIINKLKKLGKDISASIKSNSYRKETYYKSTGKVIYDEFYPKLSKPIIDEIDKVFAQHYGFTEEELDFIINYDIKYRMGGELEGNADEAGVF